MITSQELEEKMIAILLSSNQHKDEIIVQLKSEYFTNDRYKKAFDIIKSLNQKKQPIDITFLNQENKIAKVLDTADIITISKSLDKITSGFFEPHEAILLELRNTYLKSQIHQIITEESIGLYDRHDAEVTASEMVKRLNELMDTGMTVSNIITTADLVKDEREAYFRRQELNRQGKTSGVDTGLTALNRFTGGWQPEFIILAGRPSMGKTALALFHGIQSKEAGIYFNLEMNPSQLCQRLILQNATGSIDSKRLRDGSLNQPELHVFESTIGEVEKMPFTIYDKPRCGVHEAIRVIRQQVRKGLCKWVIIDYLQLMTLEGFRGGNREAEVAEISRTLKAAQKELAIPIIALCQLNRQVEQRADKKPMLSDLRESGSLEQDADTVCFVYRPSYYNLSNDDGKPYTNETFYLFEKHRQGSTGTVEFRNNETITNFYDANQEPMSSYLPVPIESTSFNFQSNQFNDDNPF
jgi:replicative DNA helicase